MWLQKIQHSAFVQKLATPFRWYTEFSKKQTSGDRFILNTLAVLVIAAFIWTLYSFEQHFLIEIPAHGGSLTEGVVGSPRFINPLLALTDADRDLTTLTYAGLMGADANGTLIPVLADSYTISDDGKVYTFVLKKNVKFSDGTSVTAQDVVFTVERAQDPSLKSPELSNWVNIKADVIDAHTVQFTLPKAYAPFLLDTTLGILPAHIWRTVSNEEFPFSPLMQNPVGAGPFTVGHVTRDSNGVIERYTLKAFSGYALGRAYIDQMTFLFFSEESDLAQAVTQGKVESAYGVSPTARTDSKILRAPYSRVFGIFFNGNSEPAFTRSEVRKALSLALDRTNIVSNILGGFATPLFGPLPPDTGIENTPVPDATDQATRITDAAAVLENAGWSYDADAHEWKNTKQKSVLSNITLRTSNVPELKAIGNAIQKDWNALGVPVTIELYESGDLTQNVIRPRNYSALLFGMVIEREEDLYAFWNSSERNDPGLNISMYANHSVDDLLEDVRQETDSDKKHAILQEIEDRISQDYPAAFTHTPDFLYTVPSDLKGVHLTRIASPSDRFRDASKWYIRSDEVWPWFAHINWFSE